MNDPVHFQNEGAVLEQAAASGTLLEYVVLHHTGTAEPHYDLLVKIDGKQPLLTWRVGVNPTHWQKMLEGQLGAVRIGDHRGMYMTYQGPVSQGRGHVTREVAGTAVIVGLSAEAMRVQLHPCGLAVKPFTVVLPRRRLSEVQT